MTGVEYLDFLLEKFQVVMLPGEIFGDNRYVRVSSLGSIENSKKVIEKYTPSIPIVIEDTKPFKKESENPTAAERGQPKKEIGIHSIRGGNEVGKHTVMFFGENESFYSTLSNNEKAFLKKLTKKI